MKEDSGIQVALEKLHQDEPSDHSLIHSLAHTPGVGDLYPGAFHICISRGGSQVQASAFPRPELTKVSNVEMCGMVALGKEAVLRPWRVWWGTVWSIRPRVL